ncbi:MAG: polysaccharide deacetylase family protein [Deltaproteobacteria bacterium]|nr:polysaccharide deacetylase family protein [Deltaproteobacteria bacterium]
MSTVPVLMYHHINPNRGDMVTVTPEVFEAQMRHIKDAGYRTLTLDELLGVVSGRKLDDKGVVVTFDDGYLDNYVYAFPVLKKYGIKAAVFLVSSWVDKATAAKGYQKRIISEFRERAPLHDQTKAYAQEGSFEKLSVNWDMVKEMKDSGLVEFHSHTVTHSRCDHLSGDELKEELKLSKEAIEKALEKSCDYLCWPRGKYNDEGVGAARELGYRGVFTTEPGVAGAGADPFRIKRIVVKDRVRWFKTRLTVYTNGLLSGLYMKMSGKGR